MVAGHVIWVGADEFALLAEKGTKAVYNPVANMILADGVCPVSELRPGVRVGIGTDGSASNDSANLIEAMKVGSLLQKVQHLDPAWTSAREMLRMATVEGAALLGLDDVGTLEVGKRADVVRLAGDGPGLASCTTRTSSSCTVPARSTSPTSGSTAAGCSPIASPRLSTRPTSSPVAARSAGRSRRPPGASADCRHCWTEGRGTRSGPTRRATTARTESAAPSASADAEARCRTARDS